MPATVVDGNCRQWKVWVGKRTHSDTDSAIFANFGVEDGSSTNRAEPEDELGTLVPDTDVFGGVPKDLEGGVEAGQCREHTAGSLLAGEAVADANASWLTLNSNPQLST
jgi:hypothetical protein